ncbi:MAG: OsmC family protein [Vulcanimicrobiaceae bacterium]
MVTRTGSARWNGDLAHGSGTMRTQSGALEGAYTFASRLESGKGTNPEELIAAAHAGCYSMALSNDLANAGHVPTFVDTTAKVTLDKVEGGFAITGIALECTATVPGLDNATFQKFAEGAKVGCPVSKALAGTTISLSAKLV